MDPAAEHGSPRRGRRRHRRSPDRDRTVEADILDLLGQAGLPRDPAGLDEAERARTDAVAAAALRRITASPRDSDPWPTAEAYAATTRRRAALLRRPGRHLSRHPGRNHWWTWPPRSTLGWVVTALVVAVMFNVVAWPRDQGTPTSLPSPTAPTSPSASGPGVPTAEPLPQADGPTPAMARFSLVSHLTSDRDGDPAAAELDRLASAAAGQPAGPSGPIQHITLNSWFFDQSARPSAALVPTVTDRYYLPGGRLRNIEYTGQPLDGAGQVTSQTIGRRPSADETYPGPTQGPGYPRTLPTDPSALVDALVPDPKECPALAACLAKQLLDLHYTWVLPPGLTASLWRALADQPGVRYLGATADRLDRPAVAFSVTTDRADLTLVLYADPDTGSLLGSEEVLLPPAEAGDQSAASSLGLDLPAVVSFSALVRSERISAAQLP